MYNCSIFTGVVGFQQELFSSLLLYRFWITSRSRKKMSGYFWYVNYFWRTWPQNMNKSVIYLLTKENMMLRRWAISVLSLHQWNTKSLKIKNKDLFLLSTLFNYPQGINERLFPAVSTSPLALIPWKMGGLRGDYILSLPKPKSTTYALNSVRYIGPKLWNSIPNMFRNITNFKSFKRSISQVDLVQFL